MIKVLGDTLYQWDGERQVILEGDDAEANTVSFAHADCKCDAIVVEVQDVEGTRVADIPNYLLQKAIPICAWTWADTHTISGRKFPVKARNRPSDYIYIPTKVVAIEELKDWLIELIGELDLGNNYEFLHHKPQIENVELIGNRSFEELGLTEISSDYIFSLFRF